MWLSASLALASWPADPSLRVLNPVVPTCWARPVVMISAGHGAPNNHGNTGVWGQREEDVTQSVAVDLQRRLAPSVQVVLSREGDQRPTYDARIDRLHTTSSALLIELHTDWRYGGEVWAESPYGEVHRHPTAPGFSVLYRHQGPLTEPRRDLARSLARSLTAIGLPAYDGRDYGDLYDHDSTPGVFLDNRGLRMLWKPRVPSVIIELHHALDPLETLHWRTEPVRQAFASAVLASLVEVLPCSP